MAEANLRVLTQKGDITVPVVGGTALDLTDHDSFAGYKTIRYGNGEVGQLPTFKDDYIPWGFYDQAQSVPLELFVASASKMGVQVEA